jgi:hypothetical protein
MTRSAPATSAFSLSRFAFGAGLLAAPGKVGARWIGDDAARDPVKIVIRGLGARDVALAAGALICRNDPDRLATWLSMTIVSDLCDMAATLAVPSDSLPPNARWGTVAVAGGAALAGAALLAAAKS